MTLLDFHISAFSSRDSLDNQCALLLPPSVCLHSEKLNLSLGASPASISAQYSPCFGAISGASLRCICKLPISPRLSSSLHAHLALSYIALSLCDLFGSVPFCPCMLGPFGNGNRAPTLQRRTRSGPRCLPQHNRSALIDYQIGYLLFVSQANVAIYWLLTRAFNSLGFAWWSPFN